MGLFITGGAGFIGSNFVRHMLGAYSEYQLFNFDKLTNAGHDRGYATDPSKIEAEMDWAPRETFESGIEKTVRWYTENSAWVERARWLQKNSQM